MMEYAAGIVVNLDDLEALAEKSIASLHGVGDDQVQPSERAGGDSSHVDTSGNNLRQRAARLRRRRAHST
jgi:hypothetical protein